VAAVASSASPIRRGPLERVAAWLVTGPLGQLWSVTVDVLVLWARYARARARR
jgi:hypothetical protein